MEIIDKKFRICLNPRKIKETRSKNVRECLQPPKPSHFQTLITDIRNDFIIKSKNSVEIGRSHDQSASLPSTVDPEATTFGRPTAFGHTVNDIFDGELQNYLRGTPNNQPGLQTDRQYKEPFSKLLSYGKQTHTDPDGNKVRKLVHWYKKSEDIVETNNNETTQARFPSLKKKTGGQSQIGVHQSLREVPINTKIIQLGKCLSHLSGIRQQIRKRDTEISFLDILEHFQCIDQNKLGQVSLDQFLEILAKIRVKPDREMFEWILREFDFMEGNIIFYQNAIRLLNWKCPLPPTSKIDDIPRESQHYTTTYQDAMKTGVLK
ncbi:hypothetical protein QAD02_016956 [Eretmocerus hayati]|uniref:Uncharacterized protein n=1 Tax=Eretmocerus hayati TaxID=131215 RepID=A0ACC2PF21_9HYME|nr:hypothetical protein QAD02_016956 [Eretmocerus hayati]